MVLLRYKFYNDPLGVLKWKLTYIKYKYDVLLLYKNLDNKKRIKLQFWQQNENISILPFTGKNDLFPAPMSQAIFNLNYLHHSAAFADTIFAHQELIVSVFDM